MANADKAKVFITDSLGHRQLKQIEGFDPSKDGSITHHVNLEGQVFGSARSEGGWTITITSRLKKNTPDEVDWHGLYDDDEYFTLERQIVGNVREQYLRCRVATAPVSSDNQGNITRTVTVSAEKMDPV